MKLIDLHTHTTASDGSMSPRELVRHAKEKGLAAVAVTDHDTVDGVEEALEEGKSRGIEVIAGLEISLDYPSEFHMLGYFLQGTLDKIKPLLEDLKENRRLRNPKIVNKLNEMGFAITMEETASEAGGEVVGRPHIAKALLKKGYVKSIEEAFDKYLGDGRPAFFKKDRLSPEEGIREITAAGGIPVIAHPVLMDLSFARLDELFARLKPAGLAGIEAYYVDNTEDDTGNLLRLAIKHGLLATGGSDFHGSFKPEIKLGTGRGNLRVPYEVLEKMRRLC